MLLILTPRRIPRRGILRAAFGPNIPGVSGIRDGLNRGQLNGIAACSAICLLPCFRALGKGIDAHGSLWVQDAFFSKIVMTCALRQVFSPCAPRRRGS